MRMANTEMSRMLSKGFFPVRTELTLDEGGGGAGAEVGVAEVFSMGGAGLGPAGF